MAPPLPIPNREVKHFSVHDTEPSGLGQWIEAGELEDKNKNENYPTQVGFFMEIIINPVFFAVDKLWQAKKIGTQIKEKVNSIPAGTYFSRNYGFEDGYLEVSLLVPNEEHRKRGIKYPYITFTQREPHTSSMIKTLVVLSPLPTTQVSIYEGFNTRSGKRRISSQ